MEGVEDAQGRETGKNEPFSQIHYEIVSHHILWVELHVERISFFFLLKPLIGVQPLVFCVFPRVLTLALCWGTADSNYGVLGRSWRFFDATMRFGPW